MPPSSGWSRQLASVQVQATKAPKHKHMCRCSKFFLHILFMFQALHQCGELNRVQIACTATLTTAHGAACRCRSALLTNVSHWCLILKKTTSVPSAIEHRRLRATSVAQSLTCICFSRFCVLPERCASLHPVFSAPLRRLRLWHLPPLSHAAKRSRARMASSYTTVRSTLYITLTLRYL